MTVHPIITCFALGVISNLIYDVVRHRGRVIRRRRRLRATHEREFAEARLAEREEYESLVGVWSQLRDHPQLKTWVVTTAERIRREAGTRRAIQFLRCGLDDVSAARSTIVGHDALVWRAVTIMRRDLEALQIELMRRNIRTVRGTVTR